MKSYCVFPDVRKIYGPTNSVEQHMAVLLTDPELKQTPVGRAFALWYGRVVTLAFPDVRAATAKARATYEAYMIRTDWHGYERSAIFQDYAPARVTESEWLNAAHMMLQRVGCGQVSQLNMLICELNMTSPFTKVLRTGLSLTSLYALRFGAPKADPNRDLEWLLPELNTVGLAFRLGAKIFCIVQNWMTRTKSQKARAAAARQSTAVAQNPRPRQDRQPRRPKKAVKKRGRDFAHGMFGGTAPMGVVEANVSPFAQIMDGPDPQCISKWLKSVANPFGNPVRCPFSFNIAHSTSTLLWRQDATQRYTIPAGTTVQFWFAGRSGQLLTATHDAASYSMALNVGGVNVQTGPYPTATDPASMGFTAQFNVTNPAAAGSATTLTTTVGNGNIAPNVTAGPFTASSDAAGRNRARLVSAGYKFSTAGALSARAGTLITVCPNQGQLNSMPNADKISGYERFPSFKDHGTPLEVVTVVASPNQNDLPYYAPSSTGSTNAGHATCIAWYINDSATNQILQIEAMHNWEIAGTAALGWASPTTLVQAAKPHLESAQVNNQSMEHHSPGTTLPAAFAQAVKYGSQFASAAIGHAVKAAATVATGTLPIPRIFH